ncbi:hypothetical protein [Nannocystis pusilla]
MVVVAVAGAVVTSVAVARPSSPQAPSTRQAAASCGSGVANFI